MQSKKNNTKIIKWSKTFIMKSKSCKKVNTK